MLLPLFSFWHFNDIHIVSYMMSHKTHRLSHTFSFFLSVFFLWLDNFKWCLQSEWFFFDCLLFKLSIESFGLIIVFFSSKISFFYYYFLLLYWTYFVLVLFCWYGQIVHLCSLNIFKQLFWSLCQENSVSPFFGSVLEIYYIHLVESCFPDFLCYL